MGSESPPNPIDNPRRAPAPRRPIRGRRVVALVAALVVASLAVFWALRLAQDRMNRVKCASNLSAIGQAIQMYANGHRGKLPDSFVTLRDSEDLAPAIFVCPGSADVAAAGPTTQAVANAMQKPGTVSYVYLAKGMTSDQLNPDLVLAYEPLANHGSRGMNVLFGDGRVEWIEGARANTLLTQVSSGKRPVKFPTPAGTSKAADDAGESTRPAR